MADQRALLWVRTVGLNSEATGKGQGWAAGDRDCWLLWHQTSLPHIPLGLGKRQSWPPQLLLVLQINCFLLSCLRLPSPLPVATPQLGSKQGPICLHLSGSLPATGSPSSNPDLARCAHGVAFTAVPLTPESKLCVKGLPLALPTSSTLAPSPIRAETEGVQGLSFLCSFLSQSSFLAASVDFSI